MKILVTGADGYLGKYIIGKLWNSEIYPFAVIHEQTDLSDIKQVSKCISEINPDRIIHCAAFVPQTLEEYNDDRNKLSLNMFDNILSESECPIVFVSSMIVEKPTTKYAKYKLIGENHLQASGRAGLTIRLPGLFGLPRRDGLIYNILQAIKNKQELTLSNDFEIWMGMHVDDAAEQIVNYAIGKINKYKLVTLDYSLTTRQFIESLIKMSNEI